MSLLSWISGYDDENAALAANADAVRQQLNAEARDRGRYDDATWRKIQADYDKQFSFDPRQQEDDITDAFEEGWSEGRGNVSNFISNALNKIVADPLRAVIGGLPWWLWVLALGALGFYLWPLLRPLVRRFR